MAKTILLVDDDQVTRHFLSSFLVTKGYQVIQSGNGKDCLKDIVVHRPDAILMDVRMPGLDGLHALEVIRLTDLSRSAPIIMFTGQTDKKILANARKLGAYDTMAKPVDLLDLHAKLERIFRPEQRVVRPQAVTEPPRWKIDPVLVVDDQALNREITALQLKRLGVACRTVSSGREAVEAFRQQKFSLILMDCVMDGMDGLEATRTIRALESGAGRIPVVALTARVLEEEADKWLGSGMDDFLAKPTTREELEQTLLRWLTPREPEPAEPPVKVPILVTPTSEPIIDRKVLSSISEIQKDSGDVLVNEMIELFLQESGSAIERISVSVRAHDLDKVRSEAHALKSMSAAVGACRLSSACFTMELSQNEIAKNMLGELAAHLHRTFQEALAELRRIQRELTSKPTSGSSPETYATA